ncbi:ABC transporter ATP-binding protein [Sphingobacterium multivorum]|uniref:ABC transporter ATP-binding protein n=1 Tax=Sphingobacterium multivorum TaxID=28454 RepID=UPI003DA3AB2C
MINIRSHEFSPFIPFVIKYWAFEILMFLLIILSTACSLASPYVLGIVIDDVIPSKNEEFLLKLIICIIFINVIRVIVGWCSEYLNTWLSGRIVLEIKQSLFQNLLMMPFVYFEENKPGETIQIISHEVDKIQNFLTNSAIRFFNNIFSLLFLGIMLFSLNPRLFFIALSMLPIVIAINLKIGNQIRKLVKDTGEKEGEVYNFYFERVKGIGLIKLFNTYDYENGLLFRKLKALQSLYLKNTKVRSFGGNGSLFFISLSPLLILLVGGFDVINETMTIGALVTFIQYSNRLMAPASDVISLFVDYSKAHESAKRILPFMNKRKKSAQEELVNLQFSIKSIQIEDLSLTISETEILKKLNINFEAGKSYGVLGKNGSGKTTLVKILAKLYTPSSGKIIINGECDFAQIPTENWLNKVAVISQNNYVLSESIRSNLTYGTKGVKDREIWDVVEKVGLFKYISSLSMGLETLIGDGNDSANPSGGEIQKLCLARVFLRRPEVIILDEVTSAMDEKSKNEILSLILRSFKDKLVICITHDPVSTKQFSEVLILEDGKMVESGDPEELFVLNGKYKELFWMDLENEFQ